VAGLEREWERAKEWVSRVQYRRQNVSLLVGKNGNGRVGRR
jgi:hypothetical protein